MGNTSKHTPGPWVVDEVYEDEAGQETLGIYAEEGGYVAGIHCGPDTTIDEQDKANAHLIAAAPDMLEALRAASEWLNDMGCEHNETEPDRRCTVCIVNQAITKAEGNAQ